jgi:hypothetical protein
MKRRIAAFLILSSIAVWLDFKCMRPSHESKSMAMPAVGSRLPEEMSGALDAEGWRERVGDGLGLWVSVAHQGFMEIEGGRMNFACPCSTALRGTGNKENSYQTPLGWHEVSERFGDGLPEGAIFSERKYTGHVWTPESPTTKDLVLTRILWLSGLEPGLNAGPGIDSHSRFIYIHGTPAQQKLGSPVSLGCIRLSNKDVIKVFDHCPIGTRVLITEW